MEYYYGIFQGGDTTIRILQVRTWDPQVSGHATPSSAYISMVWPEEKLMYNFYDEMNSINTIDHPENLKSYTIKRSPFSI